MRLRKSLISTAILCCVAATPLCAAAPKKAGAKEPPKIVTVTTANSVKSPPDFAAMIGLVDKIFPPQPDPDPTRLALARTSAQAMWPDGAYGNALFGLFSGAFDRAMQLKLSDFGAIAGEKAKDSPVAKAVSIHDAALEKDPYFDQRAAAIRQALNEETAKVSAILDPKMREGLARAMARKLDPRQLGDLNAFFATPSGHAFAAQYMQLWVDPEVIRSMFSSMPEMMKLMPEAMQKVQAANDKFPKPAKPAKPAETSKKAKG